MKSNLLTVLSLMFVTRLMAAEPEIKGSPSELSHYLAELPKTVTILGEAEVRVPADQALVNLKVTAENKSLQEALRANQETRSKLLGYLKSKGVPAERVHASRFSSTPKFGWLSDKAKSYRVENVVRVTVQDEQEFQAVAGAVDSFSGVQFNSVEFQHRDKEASKTKALAQACENANQRRAVFEEKLGLTLKPQRFSGGNVVQNQNTNQMRRYGVSDASGSYPRKAGPETLVTEPVVETEEEGSSFGELVFTAQINVEYSIQTK
jgi:uncharacterized protein YggE